MQEFLDDIEKATTLKALDDIKARLFGKEGHISSVLRGLSSLPIEERKVTAEKVNILKATLQKALEEKRFSIEDAAWKQQLQEDTIDVTLPSAPSRQGIFHPLMQAMSEIISIFSSMGFFVRRGPDIESDEYNFSALNFPQFHPARTMQDTFYIGAETLLRTHTSPMQIRSMREEGGLLRIIVPGRVYRSDYDQTHTPLFHQVEGLVIGEDLHMGHLKGCLDTFLRVFFGTPIDSRFRPSFFPFTEPSAEVDIPCKKQKGHLQIGTGSDWLEVLGSGMVHPHVIRACNLDPEKVRGFAFGMGVERLAMLKYGIDDLRLFYANDQRWLKHYGFPPSQPGL